MGAFSLATLILGIILRTGNNLMRWKSNLLRFRYINLCSDKIMETDFFNQVLAVRSKWHFRIFRHQVRADGLSAIVGLVRDLIAFGVLGYIIDTLALQKGLSDVLWLISITAVKHFCLLFKLTCNALCKGKKELL